MRGPHWERRKAKVMFPTAFAAVFICPGLRVSWDAGLSSFKIRTDLAFNLKTEVPGKLG